MNNQASKPFWGFLILSAGIHMAIAGGLMYSTGPSGDSTGLHVVQVDLVHLGEMGKNSSGPEEIVWPDSASGTQPDRSGQADKRKVILLNEHPVAKDPPEPIVIRAKTQPVQAPVDEPLDPPGGMEDPGSPPPEDGESISGPMAGLETENSMQSFGPELKGSGVQKREAEYFLQEVRNQLERAKRYPWLARVRGKEGTVRLRFMINPRGEVRDLRLAGSSYSRILDAEALNTVRRIKVFPSPPSEWDKGIQIQVPLVFKLENP